MLGKKNLHISYMKKGKAFRTPKSLVKKVKNQERKIKKLMGDEELKYLNTSISNASTTDGTGTGLIHLNVIPTGDDSSGREGQEVRLTSVVIKGNLNNSQLTNMDSLIRVIVFYDKNPNLAAPTIYNAPSTASVLDNSFTGNILGAQYNHGTIGIRYKILHDKLYRLPMGNPIALAGTAWGQCRMPFKIRAKINKKSIYASNTVSGSISTMQQGSLYITLISTNASEVTMIGCSRVYYKDE